MLAKPTIQTIGRSARSHDARSEFLKIRFSQLGFHVLLVGAGVLGLLVLSLGDYVLTVHLLLLNASLYGFITLLL